MTKAGFFKRLIAALIDGVIFAALGAGVNHGFGLLWIVYETVLVSQWNGYTIGKKVMGIRVVPATGKGGIDWLKALIRALSQILSGLFLGLGYFWMLWDEKSQTWHDKIADTYVVED